MTEPNITEVFTAVLLLHGPPAQHEISIGWTNYKLDVARSLKDMGQSYSLNMVSLFIIWCQHDLETKTD